MAPSREDYLPSWLDLVSRQSSVHGLVWYSRVDRLAVKTVIFFMVMAIMVGLRLLVGFEFTSFITDESYSDTTAIRTARAIKYPNITLCHGKFFDLQKMAGKTET